MKKFPKFLLKVLIAWAIIFATSFLDGEGTVLQRAGASLVMAVIVVVVFSNPKVFENAPSVEEIRPRSTGMTSCKKCGYLGAGTGFCTRCGSNFVAEITPRTEIISCMKCGYLGAGTGFCTRCGWNRVRTIRR